MSESASRDQLPVTVASRVPAEARAYFDAFVRDQISNAVVFQLARVDPPPVIDIVEITHREVVRRDARGRELVSDEAVITAQLRPSEPEPELRLPAFVRLEHWADAQSSGTLARDHFAVYGDYRVPVSAGVAPTVQNAEHLWWISRRHNMVPRGWRLLDEPAAAVLAPALER